MSANDILDVLNVQRDSQQQPAKKKQRIDHGQNPRQSGMARELYNLLGPNTPPVSLAGTSYTANNGIKDKINSKPSPWTRTTFQPQDQKASFHHWVKGSKELLEQEAGKPYFFDKFNTKLSLPELVDEETYAGYVEEFKEAEEQDRERIIAERRRIQERELERQREREEKEKAVRERQEKEKNKGAAVTKESATTSNSSNGSTTTDKSTTIPEPKVEAGSSQTTLQSAPVPAPTTKPKPVTTTTTTESVPAPTLTVEPPVTESTSTATPNAQQKPPQSKPELDDIEDIEIPEEWSYEETKLLFELCNAFELKWNIIYDRFNYPTERSLEDLKEHFYRVCYKVLEPELNTNPNLLESLKSFSKTKEIERKQYLENLLKRTPAEIAEEESLVIEARRFELAAKKMLVERSYLLNLLDSPQTSQSVLQYQSSQGLATLYNNLMIIDKHQKKRQQQQLLQKSSTSGSNEPIPPPIPIAASSSFKKERNFQTHLQQYLSGMLKQNPALAGSKQEPSAIQQLLAKRLTVKEEEAYGLHYHANDKINPGVTLRSQQRLPGLQQRQSVLKSVNNLLQELDIPTAGGTNWKPVMPTRKTMAKYDTLLRAVVALLDVKKGKDKLESEIKLIKAQRKL